MLLYEHVKHCDSQQQEVIVSDQYQKLQNQSVLYEFVEGVAGELRESGESIQRSRGKGGREKVSRGLLI